MGPTYENSPSPARRCMRTHCRPGSSLTIYQHAASSGEWTCMQAITDSVRRWTAATPSIWWAVVVSSHWMAAVMFGGRSAMGRLLSLEERSSRATGYSSRVRRGSGPCPSRLSADLNGANQPASMTRSRRLATLLPGAMICVAIAGCCDRGVRSVFLSLGQRGDGISAAIHVGDTVTVFAFAGTQPQELCYHELYTSQSDPSHFAYASRDTSVATLDNAGLLTGRSPGTTHITATSAGVVSPSFTVVVSLATPAKPPR